MNGQGLVLLTGNCLQILFYIKRGIDKLQHKTKTGKNLKDKTKTPRVLLQQGLPKTASGTLPSDLCNMPVAKLGEELPSAMS